MASSPDDDAATLQALLAESAARIARTTRENAALAEQHEVAAATFSSRATAEIARLQQEQHRLDDVKKLRSAAIAEAEQERDAILATAAATERRVSEEVAAARTAQASAEAAHRAMVLAREKALAETLARMEAERMRQKEEHLAGLAAHTAAVETTIAGMHSEHTAAVEASRAQLAAESAAKEQRLMKMEATERAVQARAGELSAVNGFVELSVCGEKFTVSSASIARYPQSTLAIAVHANLAAAGAAEGSSKPVLVDGDPLHFLLITSYLRSPDGSLPVVSDASQLRWLEKEARYYQLDELAQLCKD
eukprot:gene17959-174_t